MFQDLPDLQDQEVSPAHLDPTVLTESLVILDREVAQDLLVDLEPLVSLDPKDLLEIKEKKETQAFLV